MTKQIRVYCDKCWQKLCADWKKLVLERSVYLENKKLLDEIKQARPKIGNDRIASWAETISDNSNLGVMHIQYLLKAMLNEAGVEFGEANPDSNADKVSGKEDE
jgi:hypothetical protein